jgi:hypothetical protein
VSLPVEPSTILAVLTKIWDFVRGLFKRRDGHKNAVVIQPVTNVVFGRYALWWSAANRGKEPGMQIVGDFQVSNNTTEPRSITAVFLIQWYRSYYLIPRRRRIFGDIMVRAPDSNLHGHYPVLPKTTTTARAIWFIFPALAQSGRDFSGRVCFVDSAGQRYWTPKFRWYDIAAVASKYAPG